MVKVKRFIVFGGDTYYPSGGMRDFKGAFPSMLDAITWAGSQGFDWWQVVDKDENLKICSVHTKREN